MPINTLGYCNKVMQVAKERGFENEIDFYQLKTIIRLTVGSRSDTLKRYIKELQEFGFIELRGGTVYQIKTFKIDPLGV